MRDDKTVGGERERMDDVKDRDNSFYNEQLETPFLSPFFPQCVRWQLRFQFLLPKRTNGTCK